MIPAWTIGAQVALLIRGPGIRVPASAPKSHEESQDSSWDFSVLSRLHIFAHFLHIGGKGVHPLHRLHGARLERLLHLVKRASCKQEPREFAPLLGSHLAHQIKKAVHSQVSISSRNRVCLRGGVFIKVGLDLLGQLQPGLVLGVGVGVHQHTCGGVAGVALDGFEVAARIARADRSRWNAAAHGIRSSRTPGAGCAIPGTTWKGPRGRLAAHWAAGTTGRSSGIARRRRLPLRLSFSSQARSSSRKGFVRYRTRLDFLVLGFFKIKEEVLPSRWSGKI